MSKRAGDDAPPETVDDVCELFRGLVPAGQLEGLLAKVREEEIDGSVLATMTEGEIKEVLGVTSFGIKRKIILRVRELFGGGGSVGNALALVPAARAGAAPAQAAPAPLPLLLTAAYKHREGGAQPQPPPAAAHQAPPPPAAAAHQAPPPPAAAVASGGQCGPADPFAGMDSESEDEEPGKDEVEDQLNAEASCAGSMKWCASKLQGLLNHRDYSAWATRAMKEDRTAQLAAMERRCQLPGMSVVVVGNTGAGKSTMLNALLGEAAVLPTNGMRACTAALVELTYKDTLPADKPYEGAVQFITAAEWEKELDLLFSDLVQEDGRAILSANEDSTFYVSWCKVVAVYGTTYLHSRVATGEWVNGRQVYKNPMVADLRRTLREDRSITRFLGTTQLIKGEDARSFRRQIEKYVDSSNDALKKSSWPLVRMVRMSSCKWDVLKTGCKLVDAPGVRDDNSARDGIVKGFIKEADSIWIVSHIGRAVNDRTAKDMLGESFRRQLLMDGQYGSLVFVATQSDNLLRSEIQRNLRLDPGASPAQCASARNDYTRERVKGDFYEGLAEMARMSGQEASAEEMRGKYDLPVFCVSAVDCQKLEGVREGDGAAKVWRKADETEVPKLRKFVFETTLKRRRATMRRQVEALVALCDGMATMLDDNGTNERETRARIQAAVEGVLGSSVGPETLALVRDFDKKIAAYFKTAIGPQLEVGALSATDEVMTTVRGWGLKPREGGLNWATYKAGIRRHGEWRIDMNEEMAEPCYRAVSTYWERTFVSQMAEDFSALTAASKALVATTRGRIAAALTAAGLAAELPRIGAMMDVAERGIESKVAGEVERAKAHASSKQREVNRGITPVIKETLVPSYDRAFLEAGPGSHARRKAMFEGDVDSKRAEMFKLAIKPVLDGLESLRTEIVEIVRGGFEKVAAEVRVHLGPAWEDASPDVRRHRAALGGAIRPVVLEARGARNKLLESQGVEVPRETVDDDDIQDVTAEARAGRAARPDVVDVDASQGAAGSGQPLALGWRGQVKAEGAAC